ncbi:MAG: hypothetical protein M1813_006316 [Trichoglossum hirsutum]|nr:MAG: hypothetical protein M1813_006316 [Trichoglossum hirsutum]
MSVSHKLFIAIIFLLLTILDPARCELRLARRLEPHPIDKRNGFQGGWALQSSTCAAGEVSCSAFEACCPAGTSCDANSLGGDTACCPDQTPCNSFVSNAPSCANSTWTLWQGGNNPFCCLADQIGVDADGSSFSVGSCVQNNVVLPSSKAATSIPQIGATNSATTLRTVSTATTSKGTAGSTPSTDSNNGSSGPTNSAAASSSSHKLSGGAIGGIVGGVIGGIALIAITAFVFFRLGGRQRQSQSQSQSQQQPPPVGEKALPNELATKAHVAEMRA